MDNRYILVRNVSLDVQLEQLPYVLVGPTGLWLINEFLGRGVFEISDREFLEHDEKSGHPKGVKPNPIEKLLSQTEKLKDSLADLMMPSNAIEPVLFFAHPGAHVTLTQPAVRSVMMDAINRFISKVITTPMILSGEVIQTIVNRLISNNNAFRNELIQQDDFTLQEEKPPEKPRSPTELEILSQREPSIIGRISNRLPFSGRQWIMLAVLVFVNILIFLAVVIVVLINAGK